MYTLPQKKRNFSEFAFLLGRSVGRGTLGQMSWPGVTDPGPGSPWKIRRLKLRFFWGRVYFITLSKKNCAKSSQCSKLVEIVSHLQDGLLSKVFCPYKKQSANTFLYKVWKMCKNWIFTLFHKMAISYLTMVRFEKIKICHTQESNSIRTRANIILIRPGQEGMLYCEHCMQWSNWSYPKIKLN